MTLRTVKLHLIVMTVLVAANCDISLGRYNFFEAWPSNYDPGDMTKARVYGINDAGDIVGTDLSTGAGIAFIAMSPATEISDLGGDESYGLAINNKGQIAGWSEDSSGRRRPCVWDTNGTPSDLLAFSPEPNGCAHAINNQGISVGVAVNEPAIFWPDGTVQKLGNLGGSAGCAFGINDSNQVVGWSETASGDIQAFIWNETTGMNAITTPGVYAHGIAYDVTESGFIVGTATDRASPLLQLALNEHHGFVLDIECVPCLWDPNDSYMNPILLDTLGGGYGAAYAGNKAGEIIGFSETAGGQNHACMWDIDGNITDLNEEIDPDSGVTLNVATGINFIGRITGWGTGDGCIDERPVVLIPKRVSRTVLYAEDDWEAPVAKVEDIEYELYKDSNDEAVAYIYGYKKSGLKGFTYKVYKDRQDVRSPGRLWTGSIVLKSEDGNETILLKPEFNLYEQMDADEVILHVEQRNKDPHASNDSFSFDYDRRGRLTKAARYVELEQEGMVELSDYHSGDLSRIPGRVITTSPNDPNMVAETTAHYDAGFATLDDVDVKYWENGSMVGHYEWNFEYNSSGGGSCSATDWDCNGFVGDGVYVDATLHYDEHGRITSIDDSVLGNILTWTRIGNSETIVFKSVFGDPDETTIVTETTELTDGRKITTHVNGSEYMTVEIPDNNDLSIKVSNWNWGGDSILPRRVSAEIDLWSSGDGVYWIDPDASQGDGLYWIDPDGLDDGTLIKLTPTNNSGLLAGTIGSEQMNICVYAARKRLKKCTINKDRSVSSALHFYLEDDAGNTVAMMTLEENGYFVLSIDSTPKEEEEQQSFKFFECWPSTLPSDGLTDDAWNYANNPTRFDMDSKDAGNNSYIAGSVTPDGVYDYFRYDDQGDIEAIITLNPGAADKCPEDYPGDINGDCKVNFGDLAMLASDWLGGTD